MSSAAIIVNTATLANPHGAASDFELYNLEERDGSLYAAGWLNGQDSSPSNPDGVGLDRIYVSSSPTLDDFAQVGWTNGQSPGTWNDAAGQTTLYNEVANPSTDTYSLVPYYGPTQPLGGGSALYYQVNDPTVVNVGGTLVMYVSAVPSQNAYPGAVDPNGNPNYQLGWCEIGYATSTDGGTTWTWQGTLPLIHADGTPLLAPVTQAFPTDPGVTYNLIAAGNGSPTAIYNSTTGLDLWYSSFTLTPPVLMLSTESTAGVWGTPRKCQVVTNAGTVDLFVSDQDVALANDGSGTLWMAATQWGGPESGDIKLYYSSAADGVNQGVNWHPWDGADGVLVEATRAVYDGLFDLVTPGIVGAGNGTITIDYSVPAILTATGGPSDFEQISQTFALPVITNPSLPAAYDGPSGLFFAGPAGDVVEWTTSNGQIGPSFFIGAESGSWNLLATGSFAGPGSTDLLFADQNGDLVDWIVSAGQVSGSNYIGTVGAGWQFLAPGDCNGDGTTDLLFSGPGGAVVDWTMQDGQLSSAGYIGTMGAGWRFLAAGHFNGDATSDLLFGGPAGQIVDWVISDSQVVAANYIGTPGGDWRFLATGDFNGDGTTDMLFNDPAGDVIDWIIRNNQAIAFNYVGNVGSGWGLVATGDYNGDGTTDLLFSGPGGTLVDSIVKNGQLAGSNYVGTANGDWTRVSNVY